MGFCNDFRVVATVENIFGFYFITYSTAGYYGRIAGSLLRSTLNLERRYFKRYYHYTSFVINENKYPHAITITLQWRHNETDGVSNHQPRDCLLNSLFMRRSKKTSQLRVTGLCEENSPGTGEFPTQKASNAENFPFDDVIMSE